MTVLSIGALELVFGAEEARNWLSCFLSGIMVCRLHDLITSQRQRFLLWLLPSRAPLLVEKQGLMRQENTLGTAKWHLSYAWI